MKKVLIIMWSMFLILSLAACTASSGDSGEESLSIDSVDQKVRLTEDYEDALPVQTQLALGSLSLEETDMAIDEELAAELLPLWQAYQSLSNSDTTSASELTAVLNQIQDTMVPDQIQAIAAMEIAGDEVSTLIEDLGIAFRPGGGFGGREDGENASGGTFPRGGGLPGGGPGGGLPGEGPGGGGFAQLSEDDRATRIAEFAGEDFQARFAERAALNGMITLLQLKTGEIDEEAIQARTNQGGRGSQVAWGLISEETGISIETIQEETADGATLAEIITENGGDMEAVHAALVEAFVSRPNMQEEDIDQFVTDLLNGASPVNPGGS